AAQIQAIRAAATPVAALGAHPGLERLGLPAASWTDAYWNGSGGALVEGWRAWLEAHREHVPEITALSAKIDVPAAEVSVQIDFARTERGERSASTTQHYALPIDSGRYYLELAVMVPVTFHGERTAQLDPTLGTTELRAGIREDWHVAGALMVDF